MADVTTARVLLALAAAAWLVCMALPVTTHGTGSALSGHALADLVGSGRLPGQPRWLGPAWYLMPLGGAVVLTSLGMSSAPAGAVRWAAAAIATASALVFTVLVTDLDVARFGAGAWTGIAGSGLAACAVGSAVLQHMRDKRRSDVLH